MNENLFPSLLTNYTKLACTTARTADHAEMCQNSINSTQSDTDIDKIRKERRLRTSTGTDRENLRV